MPRSIRLLTLTLTPLFLAFGLAAWLLWPAGRSLVQTTTQLIEKPGAEAFKDGDLLNVLVLGLDKNWTNTNMPTSRGARTDTLFVLSFKRDGSHMGMLSIPRDTWIEEQACKINAVYGEGGVPASRAAVEKLLGISIQRTVLIRIEGAYALIDALGGITLDVERDMDYDDHWGHLHIHLKRGVQKLNGEEAVGYARFRNDAEGDRGRMRRQQQLMRAVVGELSQVSTLANPIKMKAISDILSKHIESDLPLRHALDLAAVYRRFDRRHLRTGRLDGRDDVRDGQAVIVADERQRAALVARVVHGTSIDPSQVGVAVLNGCGIQGAAARLASVLEKQGYRIVRIGNFDGPSPRRSSVMVHRSACTPLVAHLVGGITAVNAPPSSATPDGADVTVVLGNDWSTLQP